MRLLFLTQLLPYPPDSGGKIKAYYLLRHLATSHQLILVSFVRSEAERNAALPILSSFCEKVETVPLRRSRVRDMFCLASSLLRRTPFLIARDYSPVMAATVRRLIKETRPDLLHIVQLNMAQYVLDVPGIPRLLDQENVITSVVERMYRLERPGLRKFLLLLEWRKMQRYEAEVCSRCDHVLTVTEEDKATLSALIRANGHLVKIGDQAPITAVPIGVDPQSIRPVRRRPDARSILFIGSMVWPPNSDGISWFIAKAFPLIRAQLPDVQLVVIGRQPPATVQTAAQRLSDTVVATGYADDLTPYLEQAGVFIVPLRAAGGMRVKILDAFAWGIPVVSTSIGAEGITVTPGQHILVADEPEDFAQAVARVLQDENLATRLAVQGRRLVEAHYDWRIVYRKIDEVYASVMKARGQR